MELGEKLRQARLEAGLSQRALCGDTITRNMLSQIEHGAAGPSLDTLKILAQRLGKPVSYFLQEDVPASPNSQRILDARQCYDAGDYRRGVELLEDLQEPDPVYGREGALLLALCRLSWAAQLLAGHREPYAQRVLEGTRTQGVYCEDSLEQKRLSLLAQVSPVDLPSLDEALLLRAELAQKAGDYLRSVRLLEAAEDRDSPRWCLLRGRARLAAGEWDQAAQALLNAEEAYPKEVLPALEQCFQKLGDYQRAYEYACKQRTL